jgi:hypothetical protein
MAKAKYDWVAIKVEWDAGQLSIRELALQFGIPDHSVILKHAMRKGWGPRPKLSEIVTDIVTRTQGGDNQVVTMSPRVALQAFERVIQLLLRHRRMAGSLADEIESCIKDLAQLRDEQRLTGKKWRLYELESRMAIAARGAAALKNLAPIERRAFGIQDNEGPSEFDGFSQDQLEALSNMIQKALGTVIRAQGETVTE